MTALIGTFPKAISFSDAKAWAHEKLSGLQVEAPVEMYCKGDFRGLLFLKFLSQRDRDRAVERFRASRLFHGEAFMWMAADQPIEIRVPLSVLRNVRKQLIDWDFPPHTLRIDESSCTLSWNGDLVLQTGHEEGHLQVYFGEGWEVYLAEGRVYESLKQEGTLQKAWLFKYKGEGKGKGKGNKGESGGGVSGAKVFGLQPQDY